LIFILVRRYVIFKLGAFHVRQTNFASYDESTVSPVRGLLIVFCICVVVVIDYWLSAGADEGFGDGIGRRRCLLSSQ